MGASLMSRATPVEHEREYQKEQAGRCDDSHAQSQKVRQDAGTQVPEPPNLLRSRQPGRPATASGERAGEKSVCHLVRAARYGSILPLLAGAPARYSQSGWVQSHHAAFLLRLGCLVDGGSGDGGNLARAHTGPRADHRASAQGLWLGARGLRGSQSLGNSHRLAVLYRNWLTRRQAREPCGAHGDCAALRRDRDCDGQVHPDYATLCFFNPHPGPRARVRSQ